MNSNSHHSPGNRKTANFASRGSIYLRVNNQQAAFVNQEKIFGYRGGRRQVASPCRLTVSHLLLVNNLNSHSTPLTPSRPEPTSHLELSISSASTADYQP
jgi:hypothetical protein